MHDHWGRMLRRKAEEHKAHAVYAWKDKTTGKWEKQNWESFIADVENAALALIDLGIEPGDKVAIWSENMPQWLIADMAISMVRGVSVPLYANATVPQAEYILDETSAKVIFAGEQEQWEKAQELVASVPTLTKIITFDIPSVDTTNALTFAQFLDFGKLSASQNTLSTRKETATGDDLATLIYTSGTTGVPKGVMLLHSSFIYTLRSHEIKLDVKAGDISIAFLPMSHIFERAWVFFCLNSGVTIYFNRDPRNIQQTLTEVHPHYMCTVPRFWEKVYSAVNEKVTEGSPLKLNIFNWSLKVGSSYYLDYKRFKKPVPLGLKLKFIIANALVFKKIREKAGLSVSKFFPCAGAAISKEVATFFHSLGLNIKIGYGLTETTATVCALDDYDFDLGTIGTTIRGVEVKIGDNNEIMIKGPTVMKGYYKKPEETAAVFEDGWLKTGDAGRITDKGHLVMTERIKELYKTATGKYIAPNHIESKLAMDKYIEQIVVFGDDKKYVTALIAPSVLPLKEYAKKANIAYENIEDLLINNKIIEFFEERLAKLQTEFARFEQIKKFKLLKHPFSVENGELTSTLKLRRLIIKEKYKKEIDEMYKE